MTVGNAAQRSTPWSRTLGRYELRYRLASGGMASVYLAKARGHAQFEKWVAVKVIAPQLATDRSFVRMFLDEARLVARLNHPNICAVLDFGEADSTYFLTMEYLHGESLSTLIKSSLKIGAPLPVPVACRIVADAARGLHAAHELKLSDGRFANVVHRDVSPQNIFVLYDGVTKVVDFGIARSVDRTAERTSTGMIKGKLAYMAPEQLRGIEPDRRVDVFALGVVLWECITGKRLFQRQVEAATMCAVLQDPIQPPSSVAPGIAKELDAIIEKALCRNPDERYQTAAELAREIDRFVASRGVPAGPDEVADLMKQHFAERIAQRDKLLHADLAPAPNHIREEAIAVESAFGNRETIAPPPDESDESDEASDETGSRSAVGRKPQPTQTNYGTDAVFSSTGTPSMPINDAPTGMAIPSRASGLEPSAPKSNRALIALFAVALPLLGAGVALAVTRAGREPARPSVLVLNGPTAPSHANPAPFVTPASVAQQTAAPTTIADAAVAAAPTQPIETQAPTAQPPASPGRARSHTRTTSAEPATRNAAATQSAPSGPRTTGVRAATNFDTL
ncbi:MAG: protein kinase [Polyangiales bacterium]